MTRNIKGIKAQEDFLRRYSKEISICSPEDFDQLEGINSFHDIAVSYLEKVRIDEDVSKLKNSSQSFVIFLHKYHNCNQPEE